MKNKARDKKAKAIGTVRDDAGREQGMEMPAGGLVRDYFFIIQIKTGI